MEDFSQSRGDDDLFDDEIVPIEPPQEDLLAAQVQQITLQPPAPVVHGGNDQPRGPRGRGRGGAPRALSKKNDLAGSKWASQPAPVPASTSEQIPAVPQDPTETLATESESPVPENDTGTAPQAPAAPQPASRPAAVRGDRTGTGGIKKPKLTEDELTAKLSAAKERSQNLSAAHARAQADAASFEERERVAQKQRAKEVVNRKQMDTERQKNAARKAAAMGGREWDENKNEEDFRMQGGRGGSRRRGGQMRTMNGTTADRSDPSLDDLSQYQWHEGRGRGRGDRGRGRGTPRGGRGEARGGAKQTSAKAEGDFPALPMATKMQPEKQLPRPNAGRTSSEVFSPVGEKTSWADQVGEEAKA